MRQSTIDRLAHEVSKVHPSALLQDNIQNVKPDDMDRAVFLFLQFVTHRTYMANAFTFFGIASLPMVALISYTGLRQHSPWSFFCGIGVVWWINLSIDFAMDLWHAFKTRHSMDNYLDYIQKLETRYLQKS